MKHTSDGEKIYSVLECIIKKKISENVQTKVFHVFRVRFADRMVITRITWFRSIEDQLCKICL